MVGRALIVIAATMLANSANAIPYGPYGDAWKPPSGGRFDFYGRCTNAKLAIGERIKNCKAIIGTGSSETDRAVLMLAELLRIQGTYSDALQNANRAVAKVDDSQYSRKWKNNPRIEALEIRAKIYAVMGKYDEALKDSDEISQIAWDDADAYCSRCWVRAIIGKDLNLALADCNQALTLEPDHAQALYSRGLVNLKLNKLMEALADYNAALQSDSHNTTALFARGTVEKKLGDETQGDADLAEAISLNASIAADFSELVGTADK